MSANAQSFSARRSGGVRHTPGLIRPGIPHGPVQVYTCTTVRVYTCTTVWVYSTVGGTRVQYGKGNRVWAYTLYVRTVETANHFLLKTNHLLLLWPLPLLFSPFLLHLYQHDLVLGP